MGRNYTMKSAGAQLDRWWRKVNKTYVPYRTARGNRRKGADTGVSNSRKLRAYERDLGRRERAFRREVQRTPSAAAILGGGQQQLSKKTF